MDDLEQKLMDELLRLKKLMEESVDEEAYAERLDDAIDTCERFEQLLKEV